MPQPGVVETGRRSTRGRRSCVLGILLMPVPEFSRCRGARGGRCLGVCAACSSSLPSSSWHRRVPQPSFRSAPVTWAARPASAAESSCPRTAASTAAGRSRCRAHGAAGVGAGARCPIPSSTSPAAPAAPRRTWPEGCGRPSRRAERTARASPPVDQRGTGGSHALACPEPKTPLENIAEGRRYVQACTAQPRRRRDPVRDARPRWTTSTGCAGRSGTGRSICSASPTAPQRRRPTSSRHPGSVRSGPGWTAGTLVTVPIFERLGLERQRALDIVARECATDSPLRPRIPDLAALQSADAARPARAPPGHRSRSRGTGG